MKKRREEKRDDDVVISFERVKELAEEKRKLGERFNQTLQESKLLPYPERAPVISIVDGGNDGG